MSEVGRCGEDRGSGSSSESGNDGDGDGVRDDDIR